jgi:hypothetical protein
MTEENPRMGEIIIYTAPDGTAQTEVRMEANTLWLTEKQIATVFERDRTVIGGHSFVFGQIACFKNQFS